MKRSHLLRALLVSPATLAIAWGQQTTTPEADGATTIALVDEEIVFLSPFEVDASKDDGYRATDATSGTRLRIAIKDLPLPIDVVTRGFIRDIGATNLREALAYSSGMILESQNDALNDPAQGQDWEPGSGGANDPRGITGRNTNTGFKLRGFTIDQTLRDGFRRQFSTDSINIERVETVSGPQSLLYGVGSFGGVINVVPKRPKLTPDRYTSFTIGTQGFQRAEFDFTGPLGNSRWKPAFRITGAAQKNSDHTEWFQNEQIFVNPVFEFRPFPRTIVRIDNEFGWQRQQGTGFQTLRLNVGAGGSAAQQRSATFFPGGDRGIVPRTFRWSGPDTRFDVDARNHNLDVTQFVGRDLTIRAGVNWNRVSRDSRDIQDTSFANNQFFATNPFSYIAGASALLGGATYNLRQALTSPPAGFTVQDVAAAAPPGSYRGSALQTLVPRLTLADLFGLTHDPTAGVPPPQNNTTIRYRWDLREQEEDRLQYRVDAVYTFDLLGHHRVLSGVQTQQVTNTLQNFSTPRGYGNFNPDLSELYSFHNPDDTGYFRFGQQGDGQPDPAIVSRDWSEQQNWDLGYYVAWQGRFWSDRVTLIGGVRYDRSDYRRVDEARDPGRADAQSHVETNRAQFADKPPTAWSPQAGVSFAVTPAVSVYVLYSKGLLPNYTQLAGDGVANPTTAENYEAGVKLEMFEGRISGRVSFYTMKRENTPRYIWWAPAPFRSNSDPYDPAQPMRVLWQTWSPENLWYAIRQTADGLAVAKRIFSDGWHPFLERMAATPGGGNGWGTTNNLLIPLYGDPNWGTWGDTYAPANNWNGSAGMLFGEAAHCTRRLTQTSPTLGNVWWPIVDLSDPAQRQFAINVLEYSGLAVPGTMAGWPGSFFDFRNGTQFRDGPGQIVSRNAPHWNGTHVPINDEAQGFDLQFTLTPVDNWQVNLNYAYVSRRVTTKSFRYVTHPYYLPTAMWYYPVLNWGTIDARPAADAYADVTDTSTFLTPIPEYGESLDDTPKHQATFWTRYAFESGRLRGFGIGGGIRWEDRRQWYSGFSADGTGVTVTIDGKPARVVYWTDPRTTVDLLLDYRMKFGERFDARFALNVHNLMDDQGRYGWVYAPGRSIRISTSLDF